MNEDRKGIVWINIFTVKPGKLDELIAIQSEELRKFQQKQIPGWMSSRLYRSKEENKAIMVTTLESIQAHQNWLQREDFAEHRKKLEPYIERTEGRYYSLEEDIEI